MSESSPIIYLQFCSMELLNTFGTSKRLTAQPSSYVVSDRITLLLPSYPCSGPVLAWRKVRRRSVGRLRQDTVEQLFAVIHNTNSDFLPADQTIANTLTCSFLIWSRLSFINGYFMTIQYITVINLKCTYATLLHSNFGTSRD